MATTADSNPQITGIGHIYVAPVGTKVNVADIDHFHFTTGEEITGFTWLGDASSENLPEFDSDGGDATSKRTWDRKDLRVTRDAKTNSMTLHQVAVTKDTVEAAFTGSTYDDTEHAWEINLDGNSVERAILIVTEDGPMAAAHLFRRVDIAGSLPSFDLEEFSEIELAGTILRPTDGSQKYRFYEPRTVTPKPAADLGA